MEGLVNDEVQKLHKLYQGEHNGDSVSFELFVPEHLQSLLVGNGTMLFALQQRYAFRQAVVEAWNKKYPHLFAHLHADFSSYADKRTFIRIQQKK